MNLPLSLDGVAYEFNPHQGGVDMWEAGVGFMGGRVPQVASQKLNLACMIEREVIGLQSDLDAGHVPVVFKRRFSKDYLRKNQLISMILNLKIL
jgi:hypothetical protein